MRIFQKSITVVFFILLAVLIVSCDSTTISASTTTTAVTTTVTTTISTNITTNYTYPEELHDLYNLDLYNISITEVNDGSTNLIYVLKNKTDSSIEALVYEVQTQGYRDLITILIAVNSDNTIEGYYVIEHNESEQFGATIVDNDFGVTNITDLSQFDSVSGVSFTSSAIEECFLIVQNRIVNDLNS